MDINIIYGVLVTQLIQSYGADLVEKVPEDILLKSSTDTALEADLVELVPEDIGYISNSSVGSGD